MSRAKAKALAVTVGRIPILTAEACERESFEAALMRRAEELDVSYATLFCAMRSLTLGREVFYDAADHTLVEVYRGREVRSPAGSFERWRP